MRALDAVALDRRDQPVERRRIAHVLFKGFHQPRKAVFRIDTTVAVGFLRAQIGKGMGIGAQIDLAHQRLPIREKRIVQERLTLIRLADVLFDEFDRLTILFSIDRHGRAPSRFDVKG